MRFLAPIRHLGVLIRFLESSKALQGLYKAFESRGAVKSSYFKDREKFCGVLIEVFCKGSKSF